MSGRQAFPSGDSGTGSGAPWVDPAQALVGIVLDGAYSIDALIGSGGMGYVYSGTHLRLKKKIAIKIPKSDYARDATFMGRFQREALTLGRIEHESIVKIYDVRQAEECAQSISYLVMEFIEGNGLYEYLRRRVGEITVGEVLAILEQAADAIDYAHANHIVHRDLKPENIMIRAADRRPKILDFGIARVGDTASTLTMQGHGSFTPAYASPEQCSGVPAGPASDVYSFAATVYYCFAGGQHIFDCKEYTQFILAHATQDPVSLLKRNPKWPPAVAEALRGALLKQPEQRPQRCADLVAQLRRALAGNEAKPYGRYFGDRTPSKLVPKQTQEDLSTIGRDNTYGRPASLTVMEAAHGGSSEAAPKVAPKRKPRRGLLVAAILAGAAVGLGAAAIIVFPGETKEAKDKLLAMAGVSKPPTRKPVDPTPVPTPAATPEPTAAATPATPSIAFADGATRARAKAEGERLAFAATAQPSTDADWIAIGEGFAEAKPNDGWTAREGRIFLPDVEGAEIVVAQDAAQRIEVAAIAGRPARESDSKLVVGNQNVGAPQTIAVRANFDPTATLPELDSDADWFGMAWKRGNGTPDPDIEGARQYALAVTVASRNETKDNREVAMTLDRAGRQRVVVQQPGLACQWTLELPETTFPATGGSVVVRATETVADCGAPPALAATGETRQIFFRGWEKGADGAWALEVFATPNTETTPREMRVDLAGQPFLGATAIAFRQLGRECAPKFAWAVGGTEVNVGHESAQLQFMVETDANCPWSLETSAPSATTADSVLSGAGPRNIATIGIADNVADMDRVVEFRSAGAVALRVVQARRPRPQDVAVAATPTPAPSPTPNADSEIAGLVDEVRAALFVEGGDPAMLLWGPDAPTASIDTLAARMGGAGDADTLYRAAVLVSWGDFLRNRNPVEIDNFLKSHEAAMPGRATEIKELRDWYARMPRARFQPQARVALLPEAGAGLAKGTFKFEEPVDADFASLESLAVLVEADWDRGGKKSPNHPTIIALEDGRLTTPAPIDMEPHPKFKRDLKAACVLRLAGDAYAIGTNHGLYVANASGGRAKALDGEHGGDKPAPVVDLARCGRQRFLALSFAPEDPATPCVTLWTWDDADALESLADLPARGRVARVVGVRDARQVAYAAAQDAVLLFGPRGPLCAIAGSLDDATPAPFAPAGAAGPLCGADRLGRVYCVDDTLHLRPFEVSGGGVRAFAAPKEFIWGQDPSLEPGQKHAVRWRPQCVAVDPLGNVALVKADGEIEIRWRPMPRALLGMLAGS